jgi:hypothetical protein
MMDSIAKFWEVFFSGYCANPQRYVIYYQRYCRYFPEERIKYDEKALDRIKAKPDDTHKAVHTLQRKRSNKRSVKVKRKRKG